MKSTTALILVSVLATTPAIADTSDGTPRWRQNADHSQGSWTSSRMDVTPTTSADWNRDGTWAFNPGIPLTATELKAQQAANTAHRRALYNSLVNDGGCNAPVLPVEYSIPCSYNSFGKQTEGGGSAAE